ncbi:MAG TPA: carbohydrate ABC transporter permease [Candidatus Faecivicinus avistercoris]|nr:carbohydrate ABC transporter permease [Candidatus Faecivicinus avistercoris]
MAKKRSAGGIPPSRGERVFEGINLFILIILGALMLFPFLNLLAKSFSSTTAITTGQVLFLPVDFQLGTYKYVMNESQFWDSLKVSLIITIGGTAGSMLVSCLTAYPLSKTWLYGRKPLILFFVFTMLFSGGMVPAYLLMRTLNLINTIWVLFIPFLLSVYNMILLKNFFEEIPQEVEESAQLDGASNVRILVSIVLPMSLPAMATIGLFYAVGYWDNYMNGLLYITTPSLRPLQTYLYQVVTEAINVDEALSMDAQENAALNSEAIRAATIMLACIPIMCVYPFLQKYFVKGMRVGSVKG